MKYSAVASAMMHGDILEMPEGYTLEEVKMSTTSGVRITHKAGRTVSVRLFLRQNIAKVSEWTRLALKGHDVIQVIDPLAREGRGRYLGVCVDGKWYEFEEARRVYASELAPRQ
jgi:hypothetical protein